MMSFNTNKKLDNIIKLAVDSQEFASGNDKLTNIVEKYSSYLDDELSESDLMWATAAQKPAVPKYKELEK